MTTIQNIQTPSLHISSAVIRKAAGTTLALAVTAAVVFAVVKSDPAETLGTVIYWLASMYFLVLCTSIVGIAALGVGENAKEARKTQYDIH
ncbi:hypothetical protein J2X11_000078 [Aeromicrobium panaciterrae]|uniref:Uncharacterized protein n=1 Tax=Aeromicrobium panaciterrae TaxID=363861 RepID=A0ABU1UJ81_9ACTN|nr:hypothetical protein [Aeromicrobium panaciterrae]MDR7085239.1 hypothetical protein [Aeromicrobium panaciterrae]